MPDAAPVTSAICPFSDSSMSPSSVAPWTRPRAAAIPSRLSRAWDGSGGERELDAQRPWNLDRVSLCHELVRPTVGGEIGATGRAPGQMRLEFGQCRGGQFAVEIFHEPLNRVVAGHARILRAS